MHANERRRLIARAYELCREQGVIVPLVGTKEWEKFIHARQCELKRCLRKDERQVLVGVSNRVHGARKAQHGRGMTSLMGVACDHVQAYRKTIGHQFITQERVAPIDQQSSERKEAKKYD